MTEAEAYEAVCQRWKAVWDTLHSTTSTDSTYAPYVFENKKLPEPTPQVPWARVTMRQLDSNQHTLGGPGRRQFQRDAAVWVQLFRPLGEGMASLAGLVDDVRAVFEGAAFDGVDPAGSPRMQTIGQDGNWYLVLVICPVTYYETR